MKDKNIELCKTCTKPDCNCRDCQGEFESKKPCLCGFDIVECPLYREKPDAIDDQAQAHGEGRLKNGQSK